MHKKYLLSVVIPSYNAEKTIERALESIKVDRFDGLIEVIIVNDGSFDGTKQRCERFVKKSTDERIVYTIVNQKNAGHGSAINYGVEFAKGKYMRVLDADDYFDAREFDKYLLFLSKCETDLVISDYKEVCEKDGKEKRYYWHRAKKGFLSKKYDEIISKTMPTLLPCAAIKTELLRREGSVVDEKCYYDDQEYDYLIIAFCDSVSYYAKPVYCYMVGSEAQSVSNAGLINNISDHQRVLEWLVKHYYGASFAKHKKEYYFDTVLMPLCHHQYHIAVELKKSRADFLKFDRFLKKYPELYYHTGVAGKRLAFHRLTKGVFI